MGQGRWERGNCQFACQEAICNLPTHLPTTQSKAGRKRVDKWHWLTRQSHLGGSRGYTVYIGCGEGKDSQKEKGNMQQGRRKWSSLSVFLKARPMQCFSLLDDHSSESISLRVYEPSWSSDPIKSIKASDPKQKKRWKEANKSREIDASPLARSSSFLSPSL